MAELSKVAYILTLVGGILLLIFGLLYLIGATVYSPIPNLLPIRGFAVGIVSIVCGIIAIVGAKNTTDIAWAIVIIIVGVIGGGLGGLLVVLGGVVGLIISVTGESAKK
jgi:hypothetical protein